MPGPVARTVAVYVLLLIAMILDPLYFAVSLLGDDWARWFHLVPAICFGLVVIGTAMAMWTEKYGGNEDVRRHATRQMSIVLFLVIVGIFSAIQTSSWWRIENRTFEALVNIAIIPLVIIVVVWIAAGLMSALKIVPNKG